MKTNLAHVKVMVTDLEKSLKWYTEILGFEVDIDSRYPEINPVYYDFKSDGGLVLLSAWLKKPSQTDGIILTAVTRTSCGNN